ncbi:hypothetical protein [Vibrio mexicanus]|uniref:hypothetical protein n=1 Tax=Vibrio mexicanus TaxID=1004326 RepID=UPI00063C31D5|nr:hypothetical protein [Vibrio mexicanus]
MKSFLVIPVQLTFLIMSLVASSSVSAGLRTFAKQPLLIQAETNTQDGIQKVKLEFSLPEDTVEDRLGLEVVNVSQYLEESEDIRTSIGIFSPSSGGIYFDKNRVPEAELYTAGYFLTSLPERGHLTLLPSINFVYADLDLEETAKLFNRAKSSAWQGHSVGKGKAIVQTHDVDSMIGGDSAQLVSANLYGRYKWGDEEYTAFHFLLAESISGVALDVFESSLIHRFRVEAKKQPMDIYLKAKYHYMKAEEINDLFSSKGHIRGDEASIHLGFNWQL